MANHFQQATKFGQSWALGAVFAAAILSLAACTAVPVPGAANQAGGATTTNAAAPATAAATAAVTETTAAAAAAAATGAVTETAAAAATGAAAPDFASVTAPSTDSHNGIPVGFTKEGFPYIGDPKAPVVVLEYSDYQCPFCVRYFVQTEPGINDAYVKSGKVRIVFRDFPLVDLHPNAPAAHVAALCVAQQGAANYWNMHDKIFQTQSEWSNAVDPNPVFERLAGELKLDTDAFKKCVAAGEVKKLIDQSLLEGQSAGVGGTPSFQLRDAKGNKYLLEGAQPYETFAANFDAMVAGQEPPIAKQQTQQQGQGQQGQGQIPVWATAQGWAPDPNRPGINMAGDEYRGNQDAKVTIIEFSDFQCPFCKQYVEQTEPTLDQKYLDTGKVKWVFKNFPLTNIHPYAKAGAIAAECAADQNKFWEMRKALFDNQDKWAVSDTNPGLLELAKQINLDTAKFESCLKDEAVAKRVDSDMSDGAQFVRGTPTFIVLYGNEGKIIPGALPADQFAQVIDSYLSQVK